MKLKNKKLGLFIFDWLRSIQNNFLYLFKIASLKTAKCNPSVHIEEINLAKKTVTIHCEWVNTPITLSMNEIINDPTFLANMSPKQTAWVGYYYGKHYKDQMNEKYPQTNPVNFCIDSPKGIHDIQMINRHGDLIYSSILGTRTISPINAIINENIISHFSSLQACYIGILAGTSTHKRDSRRRDAHLSKPPLAVIK